VTLPETPGETASLKDPSSRVGYRRGRWLLHLAILGLYPLLAGGLSFARGGARMPILGHTPNSVMLVSVYQLGIFAALFGVAWLASRASAIDLQLRWRPGWKAIPLGILYSLGLRLALALVAILVIVGLMLGQVIRPEDMPMIIQSNRPNLGALVDVGALGTDPAYFWLNVILVSFVVAGLREELWRAAMLAGLRAVWPDWFGSRPGQIAAVGVAAALFGLGHVSQGPAAVGAAGLLGFGLGVIMVLHRSIWPAVITHGLFDATTFAVLPLLSQNMPPFH
jgi:membrane protease YdiL (CAAX protease family)